MTLARLRGAEGEEPAAGQRDHGGAAEPVHAGEAGHQARVRLADLNPGQAPFRGRPASQARVPLICLDQDGADVITAGMTRQDPDDIVPLPGAQADPARWCPVYRVGQVDRTRLSRAISGDDGSS